MKLKTQLRTLLKLKGINAAELSRQSGVPKQSISDWLGGTMPRNIAHVKKVADALNVTVDELCFGGKNTDLVPSSQNADLDALLGDQWISGLFEVKLRRVKR